MFQRLAVHLVHWCWRHSVPVLVIAAILTAGLAWYAGTHLGIDTDEGKLISADLPFRKAERMFDKAFPQTVDTLVVVVDGPSPAQAEEAVGRIAAKLAPRQDIFRSVRRPAEEVYFHANGLLFLTPDELTNLSDTLVQAQPFLGSLARDPSLRGLLASLDLAAEGASRGLMDVKDLAPMLGKVDEVAAAVAAGKPAPTLSWQTLFGGSARDKPRRFLITQPVLQYGELVSGGPASEAIQQAAAEMGVTPDHGYRVRLTGSVALNDANFATVTQGVEISAPLSLVAVCVLLYLAVRSKRVVGAILISLMIGLVTTAAFAALTVHDLNPISMAFAVMFVGIAVDFAIQFVVRFRDERFNQADEEAAVISCARKMAGPLTVAAATTAVGFLSFLPTAYTGVSQLGLIAGGGMIIALLVDLTLLPALLAVFRTPPEQAPVGLPLAAADRWLSRHCRAVVVIAVLLALLGAALVPVLPIDFNPLHLQNPREEAVSTFLELASDPDSGAYASDILAPSRADAVALADKLEKLPEVDRAMTIETFVPEGQSEKLAIIHDVADLLAPTLTPATVLPAPSDDQLAQALNATADKLDAMEKKLALQQDPPLAQHLRQIAAAGPKPVAALQQALIPGVVGQISELRRSLAVQPISFETLPDDLKREWLTSDGRARIQAVPNGDLRTEAALVHFADAIQAVAPNATGLPIAVEESGKVVLGAFIRAGVTALIAVAILLGIMLRRWLDAALVVLPLVMGSLYTVIGMKMADLAINFANIIALPLLLGIGVAFNIYFVVNWRNGLTTHLQSATTRAVLFSALTTGLAFGSLAVSPHLGTASMGLLLFLSLALSVATTFIVLPALFCWLGKPKS